MERKNICFCRYRIYCRGILKSGNLDLHAHPAVVPTSEVKFKTKKVRKNFLTLLFALSPFAPKMELSHRTNKTVTNILHGTNFQASNSRNRLV